MEMAMCAMILMSAARQLTLVLKSIAVTLLDHLLVGPVLWRKC